MSSGNRRPNSRPIPDTEPRRTPLLYRGNKRTIEQLQRDGAVHVLPPVFPICGHGDLPVGPLTGQVDADAGDDRGPVLQAEGGEVQTAGGDDTRGKDPAVSQIHRTHDKVILTHCKKLTV